MTQIPDTRNVPRIPSNEVQNLLGNIAGWGSVTTIVIHLGCVFEFKGDFPAGSLAEGYYNLAGTHNGFHGHIKLEAIDHVAFQTTPHRGKASFALVFNTIASECIFKIFLGRDAQGEILSHQLAHFNNLLDIHS